MNTFSGLRAKEVIRLCDAASLGCVTDIAFDGDSGRICALHVSGGGLGAVFAAEKTVVPWERITCIGQDTILVDLPPQACGGEKRGRRGLFDRKCK